MLVYVGVVDVTINTNDVVMPHEHASHMVVDSAIDIC